MENVSCAMDIPGGGIAFSRWLERAVTDAPAFREKGLVLLRGILPDELTGRDLPPRTQAQWSQRVIPYVLFRGDTPLAALLPKSFDAEGYKMHPSCMGAMFSPEDPSLAVPGLLQLTCLVETGERPQDERPVRTLLARLLTMPQRGAELPACKLVKLPGRLRGSLLKLDLLREVWPKGGELRLEPTQFGCDSGLVAVWSWNGDEVSQTVMCHPRSLPFLEELAEKWLAEKPGHSRRGPKPLARRLERVRDGCYSSPSKNEAWFLDSQDLPLDEAVEKRAADILRRELGLSPDVTWGEAGAAFYRRQADAGQAWAREEAQSRLKLLCPKRPRERQVG